MSVATHLSVKFFSVDGFTMLLLIRNALGYKVVLPMFATIVAPTSRPSNLDCVMMD
jgi:hypothetical protein